MIKRVFYKKHDCSVIFIYRKRWLQNGTYLDTYHGPRQCATSITEDVHCQLVSRTKSSSTNLCVVYYTCISWQEQNDKKYCVPCKIYPQLFCSPSNMDNTMTVHGILLLPHSGDPGPTMWYDNQQKLKIQRSFKKCLKLLKIHNKIIIVEKANCMHRYRPWCALCFLPLFQMSIMTEVPFSGQ